MVTEGVAVISERFWAVQVSVLAELDHLIAVEVEAYLKDFGP